MPRRERRHTSVDKPAREQLKDLFSLHQSERRGILVLMLVMTLLMAWVVYEQWIYEPPTADLAPIEIELRDWLERRSIMPAPDTIAPADIYPFDPNTLARQDWVLFGLTEKQTEGIMRFKEKGGVFRVKRDVERMYTISPEMYERLEPYILLPDEIPARTRQPQWESQQARRSPPRDTAFERREPAAWRERSAERPPVTPLDVNRADTMELVTLPGIGPAFARGIVKYRESLGGYHSLDQLSEVYVLRDKPEAVERVREVLLLEPGHLRRININEATAEDLAAHPYISWKVANGLVNYRRQHGAFPTVEAIKGSVLVSDSLYQRIHPYLTIDP